MSSNYLKQKGSWYICEVKGEGGNKNTGFGMHKAFFTQADIVEVIFLQLPSGL